MGTAKKAELMKTTVLLITLNIVNCCHCKSVKMDSGYGFGNNFQVVFTNSDKSLNSFVS